MKIENPFENGHIKNYILAYVSVVVIMVLFFIAASVWNEPKNYPKKEFVTQTKEKPKQERSFLDDDKSKQKSSEIKLMEVGY